MKNRCPDCDALLKDKHLTDGKCWKCGAILNLKINEKEFEEDQKIEKDNEVSDQINSSNDVYGNGALFGGLLVYGLWIIPSFSIENWFSGGYFYINKWLITTFNITEDWDLGAAAGTTPGEWMQSYPMDPNDGPIGFMAWLIFFAFGGAALLHYGNFLKKKFRLEFLLYDWINTFPKEYRNKNIRYDEIEKSGAKKINQGKDGTYWFSYPDKENELDSQIHLLFNQEEEVLYFKNDLSCEWLVIPKNKIIADQKTELSNTIELKLNDRSILLSIPSISSIENLMKLFRISSSIDDKSSTKENYNKEISNDEFENIKEHEERTKSKPAKKNDLDKSTTDNIKTELKKYKEMLDDGLIEKEDYDAKKKEILGF